MPETGFDCNVQEFPGIYSDTEADCQVKYCQLNNFLCKDAITQIKPNNGKIVSYTIQFVIGFPYVSTKRKCGQLSLPKWHNV